MLFTLYAHFKFRFYRNSREKESIIHLLAVCLAQSFVSDDYIDDLNEMLGKDIGSVNRFVRSFEWIAENGKLFYHIRPHEASQFIKSADFLKISRHKFLVFLIKYFYFLIFFFKVLLLYLNAEAYNRTAVLSASREKFSVKVIHTEETRCNVISFTSFSCLLQRYFICRFIEFTGILKIGYDAMQAYDATQSYDCLLFYESQDAISHLVYGNRHHHHHHRHHVSSSLWLQLANDSVS